MKREFSPVYLALGLVLACVVFRLFSSHYPEFLPGFSPLMATAFVGAMYLPRRWGWLVAPAALLLSEVAFLEVNYRTDGTGSIFSWWRVISIGVYAAASLLGVLIARRKSLPAIIGGSFACSLLFYLAANTFSWWHDVVAGLNPGYPATLAGWWQANTAGLPGYEPTWLFLRNGMAGDLFFALLLLLILDRAVLFGDITAKTNPQTARVG